MAGNQKIIVGLKHIQIKWVSDNSFSLDGENVGQIDVDAFYYSDDSFMGKVEYPFSIVAGKYIEKKGTYFVILDEESGRLPLTVVAAVAKDGKPNTFYGSMAPIDANDPDKILDNAMVTVTSENLLQFEQEPVSQVAEKITYGTNIICNDISANTVMLNGIMATSHEDYLKYIADLKTKLDKQPLIPDYKYLDSIEFAEFGDE